MQVPSLTEWIHYQNTHSDVKEDSVSSKSNNNVFTTPTKKPVGNGKRTSSAQYVQKREDNKKHEAVRVPEMPVISNATQAQNSAVPTYENTLVRAAVSDMQKNFLIWQATEKEKSFQYGIDCGQHYETWLSEEIKRATRGMSPAQRMHYITLTTIQDDVFRMWSYGYGHACAKDYAQETQQKVLANNAQMLMSNIHEPPLAAQAIEQTMAAARESARLQGLNSAASAIIEEQALTAALQPALQSKIDNGELDLAEKLLQQHGMLMDIYTTQSMQNTLRIAREHQIKEEAFALRKERMYKAIQALLQMTEANATDSLKDTTWCTSMHLTDAEMIREVVEAVAVQRKNIQSHERAEKYTQDILWYGELVRMAIGDGDVPKDPMAALHFVQNNTTLDTKSRTAIIESLLHERIDKKDDIDCVLALQNCIFTENDAIDRMDILHHIVLGNIRCETGLQLFTMQEKFKDSEKTLLHQSLIILDTYITATNARLAARNMYLRSVTHAIDNNDVQQSIYVSSKENLQKIALCFGGNV